MDIPGEISVQIDEIVAIMNSAPDILFITGAGVSAESGIPTYRGIGGIYNEITIDGYDFAEALSGSMIRTQPEITWKYLVQIAEKCRSATYNRSHEIIAAIEKRLPRVWTLTQNVDGFHRLAGSANVIDIHGDIHQLRCIDCDDRFTVANFDALEIPPYCRHCGALVRPDVILFGELLPQRQCALMIAELQRGFGLVFSIGTTSLFPYITQPVIRAQMAGIPTVEINPDLSEVSELVDFRLPMPATVALEAIWQRYCRT